MITKSATNSNQNTTPLLFTNSARTAWEHLIRFYSAQKPVGVLLPAYIGFTDREGSGVFDPIQHTGVAYGFYRLGQQLEADLTDMEQQLRSGSYTMVLVIHYFGFCPNDLKKIKQLCDVYGVILVEDCAHAFHLGLQHPTLGITGDFSFYSLHKYLATHSGGVLKINNPDIQLPDVPQADKADVSVLEQWIRTDLNQVASIRRQNYTLYETGLKPHPLMQIMYPLGSSEIPQTFAIRIQSGHREKLYFHLMEQGMPVVALYYRMIDAISPEKFPLAHQIAFEILNLPVHQDITPDDVKLLCTTINAYFDTLA